MNYLTSYYKNLSEELHKKYKILLNEVESNIEVSSGYTNPGSVEGDPNYRNVQVSDINYTAVCNSSGSSCNYVKSLDDSLTSITSKLAPPNFNSKVWLSYIGGTNTVADLLNQFYQNWNNLNWWNSLDVKRFYLSLASPWSLNASNNYGATVNVNWTENLKKAVFQAFTGALQYGANAANQMMNNFYSNSTISNVRAHVNSSLTAYFRANGWPAAQFNISNVSTANNYSSFAPNTATGFGGFGNNNPGYFLPGLGNLSNIMPWQWNPNMGLPYPSSNSGNLQVSNQPDSAEQANLNNFNTFAAPNRRRIRK